MSSSALSIVPGGARPSTQALAPTELSPDQIALIKNTVAKGASNDELQLFLHLAQTYGLDPFAKEIWCIKYGNSAATIFTSRDGYLKIANGHPAFDGIHGDVVRERDHFAPTRLGEGETGVDHAYAQGDRGKIIGAYALVFRRDRRHPAYVFAPFDEYFAPSNGTWKKYPSAMILKVAESMALKRAFSISGLVTREELGSSVPDGPEAAEVVAETRLVRPAAPRPLPSGRTAPAFPGASLYGGEEPAQAVEVAPVTQAVEVVTIADGPHPDEVARQLDETLALVPEADGPTLRRWLDAAGDGTGRCEGWPTTARRRLHEAIVAEGRRRR